AVLRLSGSVRALAVARATADARPRSRGARRVALELHAPFAHGGELDAAEDDALDEEADNDDGEQAGEDIGGLELVAVLEDEPAEPARARAHAEHQLGGDERAPGEGPADLEAGEDRRKRRRDEDARDE